MNKLIIGGVLVAVMGGTPAATYFLTQEQKTSSTSKNEKAAQGPSETAPSSISNDSTCQPKGDKSSCPEE